MAFLRETETISIKWMVDTLHGETLCWNKGVKVTMVTSKTPVPRSTYNICFVA